MKLFGIKPRIIAEQCIEDDECQQLCDYKVMYFNGEPKVIQVHKGCFGDHRKDYYDDTWNKMNLMQGYPTSNKTMEKPIFLEKMLALNRILSEGVSFLRVEWYLSKGRL